MIGSVRILGPVRIKGTQDYIPSSMYQINEQEGISKQLGRNDLFVK